MKIAIVTGASSGIGREFALMLGALPCLDELWVVARRVERLEQLRGRVNKKIRAFAYDLTDPGALARFGQILAERQPNVQVLANCAGYGKFGKYNEIPLESQLGMIDLNCRALVAVTDAVLPFMGRGARILQMSSTSSFQPLPDLAVYAASKAFVTSYSRALSQELRPRGITCTAVCSGWMRTEFFDVAKADANPGAVQNFPFAKEPGEVARKALLDAYRGREVSLCGVWNHLHCAAAKLLPHSLLMEGWRLIK